MPCVVGGSIYILLIALDDDIAVVSSARQSFHNAQEVNSTAQAGYGGIQVALSDGLVSGSIIVTILPYDGSLLAIQGGLQAGNLGDGQLRNGGGSQSSTLYSNLAIGFGDLGNELVLYSSVSYVESTDSIGDLGAYAATLTNCGFQSIHTTIHSGVELFGQLPGTVYGLGGRIIGIGAQHSVSITLGLGTSSVVASRLLAGQGFLDILEAVDGGAILDGGQGVSIGLYGGVIGSLIRIQSALHCRRRSLGIVGVSKVQGSDSILNLGCHRFRTDQGLQGVNFALGGGNTSSQGFKVSRARELTIGNQLVDKLSQSGFRFAGLNDIGSKRMDKGQSTILINAITDFDQYSRLDMYSIRLCSNCSDTSFPRERYKGRCKPIFITVVLQSNA